MKEKSELTYDVNLANEIQSIAAAIMHSYLTSAYKEKDIQKTDWLEIDPDEVCLKTGLCMVRQNEALEILRDKRMLCFARRGSQYKVWVRLEFNSSSGLPKGPFETIRKRKMM